MYSLTFQYFRAILCDRRSASDVTGRDNAYNYFKYFRKDANLEELFIDYDTIKHNEKEST